MLPTPTSLAGTPLARRKLPIGIQTFREIIEEGYYYVDKSGYAVELAETGKYYFLSRPRRFGKSLLLDTLRALFEGQQALFKGLLAEQRWDWGKKHPVIRVSFSDGVLRDRAELDQRISASATSCAKTAWPWACHGQMTCQKPTPPATLAS